MCIAVNPYIPGEGITVTETGGVYLWSCDHSLRTIHQANHVDSKDSPWYQCVFAANPRCIAMADAKGVDLLDFRVSNFSLIMVDLFFCANHYDIFLLSLPSTFLRYQLKSTRSGTSISMKCQGTGEICTLY